MWLALYFPRPEDLTKNVVILCLVFVVFCGLALRLKLRLRNSCPLILVGGTLPSLLGFLRHHSRFGRGAGSYWNTVRELTGTNHSDAFFLVAYYLDAGPGLRVAAVGIAAALFLSILLRTETEASAEQSSVTENESNPEEADSANQ